MKPCGIRIVLGLALLACAPPWRAEAGDGPEAMPPALPEASASGPGLAAATASGLDAGLAPAPLGPGERPLPINLATALRLSDGRPLIVAAAQVGAQVSQAQLDRARVLWIPTLNLGALYYRHDGGTQNERGQLVQQSSNYFMGGGGAQLIVASTDAIFQPLAARQVLRSREMDIQTAKNDALLATAEAYFAVHQARGTYAGTLDALQRSQRLVARIGELSADLVPRVEVDRARTLQAQFEQLATSEREAWRVSSANLTRVLRLDPTTTVVPTEPDHLQITLIDPKSPVDVLVPVGLTNRPELASQQALVQAALVRLKQEKLRPLTPSVLITGFQTPEFYFNGAIFGTGQNSSLDQFDGRADVATQLVWQMEGFGLGNAARIRERRADQKLAVIDLFGVQDRVAAEVVQAQARLESASDRVGQAERELREARITYDGNLEGLRETNRFGDVLTLINRPQEVVIALTRLQTAYVNYFATVADYNRAQFGLFHALGYAAQALSCTNPPGAILPVDLDRPASLPPVPPPNAALRPDPPVKVKRVDSPQAMAPSPPATEPPRRRFGLFPRR